MMGWKLFLNNSPGMTHVCTKAGKHHLDSPFIQPPVISLQHPGLKSPYTAPGTEEFMHNSNLWATGLEIEKYKIQVTAVWVSGEDFVRA